MTDTTTARRRSADLRPGTRLRVTGTTKVEMLGERKKPEDYKPDELPVYLPGWWMRTERGRRGFSDEALDRCLDDGTYEVLDDCDPWKVVGSRGQVQYEWHQDGWDIEVEFTPDGVIESVLVSRA
jgi:hypothetical protein